MRPGLRGLMIGASIVLALLVGTGFAILTLATRDLRASAKRAHHSERVVATANAVEKQLLDLETGARGYVITHDERFLQPWRDAHRSIAREDARLVALLAGEPEQRARAEAIRGGIDSYVHDYSEPLVAAARAHPKSAKVVVVTRAGKRRVDALWKELGLG